MTMLFRVTAPIHQKTEETSAKSECLTSQELQDSERKWIRFVQRKNNPETFQALSTKTKDNLQKQLGLYVDD